MQTQWFLVAFYIYVVLVIASLISEERDPSTTLAWILVLLLAPGVGVVAYLLFGRDWRAIAARDPDRRFAVRRAGEVLEQVRARWADKTGALMRDTLVSRVSRAITAQCGTTPLPCRDLEIITDGSVKFTRLYRDIEQARSFVHLEYFIWGQDELTGRLCELLAQKVEQGVEVRVLYDWIGSLLRGKQQLRMLRSAGAYVRADTVDLRRLSSRNHRKMAVIDGEVGYTGGMNMGQEYVDGGTRFVAWRDTHVRFTGPLVADLHALFCTRWFRTSGEDLFSAEYFDPSPETEAISSAGGGVWAQLAFSGPESQWQSIKQAYLIAVSSARMRVFVQSPYYVPDASISDAIASQALAGVDVRLMMAGVPDKRMPWWAAFSYIDELLAAGARVLQYRAGFFHPKTVTIDGVITAIGTTNIDVRSFALHDELQIFFYDEDVTASQDAVFLADESECAELSLGTLMRLGPLRRFRNAVARLASRVM